VDGAKLENGIAVFGHSLHLVSRTTMRDFLDLHLKGRANAFIRGEIWPFGGLKGA
jgi:hypothetical protein